MKKIFPFLFLWFLASTSFGQFTKKQGSKLSGGEITFIAWADIDADSLMEAVSVVNNGGLSSLYSTKFSALKADTTLLSDSIAAIASPCLLDWNGDNRVDFIFPISGPQNAMVLINQGNLGFKKTKIALGSGPLSKLLFTNVTNDGTRQVLVIKNSSGWSLFRENGNGYSLALDSSYTIMDFYTFDFDGNGYNDIALSGTDSIGNPYLKIIEFEKGLQPLRQLKIANPVSGKIESADLNADGFFDLVVNGLNKQGKLVTQAFINHDSSFVVGNSYPALHGQSYLLADFDSDGAVDFATLGKDDGGNLLHWLKTAVGDSILLPTANVTQHAFGDVDRDGDLDLLVATDTLGIVVFENSAAKNHSPLRISNSIGAMIYNHLFIYWDKTSDDHTATPSLTYDLTLNRSGDEILDGAFDEEGLRQTTTNGNLGTDNFLLMKAAVGTYSYQVEAIDNSFFSKFMAGGQCGGSCVIQKPRVIDVCNNKPIQITTQEPQLWFSFTKGFLGSATSVKVPARTDTIFSLLPHTSSVCNAITVYLLNAPGTDTLRVTQNLFGCENAMIALSVAAPWQNVVWKDAKGDLKGSGNTLTYSITKNESVIGIGSNSNGCFIKQTENITLSKPMLNLEGTDYRILVGSSAPLGVSGADSYLWSPPDGLDKVSSSNPIASPQKTTLYTVTGYDSLNCPAQGQVLVEVFSAAFIPNLFSPNGDGKNDELKIYGLSDAHDFHFSVYNREGSMVYETADWMNVNWDGTKNGVLQPSGLYYWKVEGSFVNGDPLKLNEKMKGSVLLVR